ncbi:hypothetical protein L7F22_050088 [Adiantum nelumboides]|nr:hypothetical protein [Adiantum nelumboides]
MEALQTAVASCHPLPPLSFTCNSQRPTSSSSSSSSSFAPISSSAPLLSQKTPLHVNPLKVPSNHHAIAAEADHAPNHRPKSLILMRSSAASGYAAALAEIGQSKRILNLIYADLKQLAAFLQLRQLHGFLINPSIRDAHKKQILARLAEEAAFLPYTLKVLNLMVDRKRAALLKDMVKEFTVIYGKITTTEMSMILSATQLHPTQLASIAKHIPASSIPDAADPAPIHLMGYIVNYGKDTSTASV